MATLIKDIPSNSVNITYNPNRFAPARKPPMRLSTEKIMMETDAIDANMKGIRILFRFPSCTEAQKSTEARE